MADLQKYLYPEKHSNDEQIQRMGVVRQVNAIMLGFNFNRVRNIMHHLDWTYDGSDFAPSEKELRDKALELLYGVWDLDPTYYCAMSVGGFVAKRYMVDGIKRLELAFETDSWHVTHEEASTIDG